MQQGCRKKQQAVARKKRFRALSNDDAGGYRRQQLQALVEPQPAHGIDKQA
jgi:hypothetical protein